MCVLHEDWFTDSKKWNDASLKLVVSYSYSRFSHTKTFCCVWNFCDALQTLRFVRDRLAILHTLSDFATLRSQTALPTIYFWFCLFCGVRVSHEETALWSAHLNGAVLLILLC